jgi:hypothetical protein
MTGLRGTRTVNDGESGRILDFALSNAFVE